MVLQRAVKTYPMLKWFLIVSAVLVVTGIIMSKLITAPDDAEPMMLVYFLVPAIILPFIAVAMPRREVLQIELPSDHLANASRTELQGMLDSLEEGKRKGELSQDRYNKARDRIVAVMKAKK